MTLDEVVAVATIASIVGGSLVVVFRIGRATGTSLTEAQKRMDQLQEQINKLRDEIIELNHHGR